MLDRARLPCAVLYTMRRTTFAVTTTLVVLLASACASERSTVSDGPLQKRRFRPGWHWDFPVSRKGPHARPGSNERAVPVHANSKATAPAPAEAEVFAHMGDAVQPHTMIPLRQAHADRHGERSTSTVAFATLDVSQPAQADEQAQEQTTSTDTPAKKRWNPWAAPALAAALGTVAIGLFTTSTIAVLIGVVIAIVLAAIALRRGRQEELAGKGLAIAAMIVCMLTVLATAAAIVVVGFV